MAKRIIITPNEVRVSKPGYDASTAGIDGLVFYENMRTMAAVATGEVMVAANSSVTMPLPYSFSDFPYVIVNTTNQYDFGGGPGTYYAEMQKFNGVYGAVKIVNVLPAPLVIAYSVCRAI